MSLNDRFEAAIRAIQKIGHDEMRREQSHASKRPLRKRGGDWIFTEHREERWDA